MLMYRCPLAKFDDSMDLLFQQLAAAGAEDELIRALHVLYANSKSCVRTAGGYGEIFDIFLGTREGGVESPILYALFVYDLVQQMSLVTLDADPLLLAGTEIRLLQFADDVAIIARTEEDLDRLLLKFEEYSDHSHQRTSIPKTKAMVVSFEGDSLQFFYTDDGDDGDQRFHVRQRRSLPFSFLYKYTSIEVIAFFIYLGVYFHWQLGGGAAFEYREEKGVKAFGALCGQLQLVPFLPFSRTVELGESIVGCAYL